MSRELTRPAVVKAVLPEGRAEVTLLADNACSGDCSACRACGKDGEETVTAVNTASAKAGERVTVSVRNKRPALSALLRVILPIASFAAGCGVASLFTEKEGVYIACGILCGCVCGLIRKRHPGRHLQYEILSING